jgi:hypothetical protein
MRVDNANPGVTVHYKSTKNRIVLQANAACNLHEANTYLGTWQPDLDILRVGDLAKLGASSFAIDVWRLRVEC